MSPGQQIPGGRKADSSEASTGGPDREDKDGVLPPEQFIARQWGRDPQCVGVGQASGASAAIWGQNQKGVWESSRPGLPDFHVLTVPLARLRSERWQDGRSIPKTGDLCLIRAGTEVRSVVHGSWRV